MAVEIALEQRFPVSVDDGFAYITDPANWPQYWPGLIRVVAAERWREPGDEAVLILRLMGRPVEMRMTLTRFEPSRLVEYTSVQSGLPPARHRREFASVGGQLHYRAAVELTPRAGRQGIVDRVLVARAVRRTLRRTLANLERRFG
jgi:uncharacterized protein YndB with AHSA1/START domain